MWSKIIFIAAVTGTARISPIAPQSHPQNSNASVTASGLSWTRLPTIFGYNTFIANTCKARTVKIMASASAPLIWPSPAKMGGTSPRITPK